MVTSRQIRAAAIALLNVAEIYDTAERGATDGFDMLACSGIKSLTSATGQHFGKDGAWSIHFTEYFEHDRPYRGDDADDNRVYSNWFGDAARMRNKAYDLVGKLR